MKTKRLFVTIICFLCIYVVWGQTVSVKQIMAKAEKGDVEEQFKLGSLYDFGDGGLSRDSEKAKYWYQKSAEQGYAKAQNSLGLFYELGKGLMKDYEKAIYWYQKSAEQGYAIGQYNLGRLYEKGHGIDQDYEKAVYWYQKSVANNGGGYYRLGYCYENGLGVSQDYKKAYDYYHKGAEKGDDLSKYGLFICYHNGYAVKKDESKANIIYDGIDKNKAYRVNQQVQRACKFRHNV
ncbi:MAG: sel1 repeat family protein [Bacteroidaceae bacterium]|nr:sel1 repeat family protein [Bacteroidaceae bacterium]